jgi:hypothetical protein
MFTPVRAARRRPRLRLATCRALAGWNVQAAGTAAPPKTRRDARFGVRLGSEPESKPLLFECDTSALPPRSGEQWAEPPEWAPKADGYPAASLQQREGDHVCVLGTNGAGKATLAAAMLARAGAAVVGRSPRPDETESVSFTDHERFVREHGGETVVRVLGGPNDAAVRQLIVQLGLYDCWPKRVEVLN